MQTNRRGFIKTGALAVAGAVISSRQLLAAAKKKGILGVQLYSIRDDMSKDPLGSLKKVAQMGYVYVEHANYVNRKLYGWSATEFRKVLDDLGLKMISGHTVMGYEQYDSVKKDFTDSWKQTVEDAAILGQKYVTSPWMDERFRDTPDNFKRCMEIYNSCGRLCQKNGMKFGYHNHDFEFSQKLNGEKLFDVMMKSIDPELVVVQLDIGNLYSGGGVAMDVVKQYPGRFENVHVKDVVKVAGEGDKYESTIVGEGIVDVKSVMNTLITKGGMEVYIIEQESYNGQPPMQCIEKDLAVLKSWGY
jgi:sugar phosphate isomerase/epimerase